MEVSLQTQIFGILAPAIALVSFFPYVRDIFAKRTTPHMYSWLVWAILQITAATAILQENSLWSALGVFFLGLVSLVVFLLSFKYGTRNITKFDTTCLIGALAAIGVWIFLDNVLVSIVLISVIDFVGFLPTYRKGYEEPHSETAFLYVCSFFSNIFSLLAIAHHSVESSLYVASLVASNAIFITILFVRRRTMRGGTKKIILVDADGVVLKKAPYYFSEKIGRENNLPSEEMTPFYENEFRLCQDGKADLKEEISKYLPRWKWDKGADEFLRYWFTTDAHVDEEVFAEIKQLRAQGFRCYLATDQEKYRAQYLLEDLNLKDQFDGFFFSYELGARKFRPEFFQRIIETLGVTPQEVAYWDDEEENVEAAKTLGIDAHLYKNLEQFKIGIAKIKNY